MTTAPTNNQIDRLLAEKVMGWTLSPAWNYWMCGDSKDSSSWMRPARAMDGEQPPWSPTTNRNDLADVLAKLTPDQWFKVFEGLDRFFGFNKTDSPGHGWVWWTHTCDPSIIARAVAEVVRGDETPGDGGAQ